MANVQRGGRPSKRLHILYHAVDLASQAGPQGFTLDNLCEQSNISKGGVLYHFPSVPDLVRDMFEFYICSRLPTWIEDGHVTIPSPNLDAPSFTISQLIELLNQAPLNPALERLVLNSYSHTPFTLPYGQSLEDLWQGATSEQRNQLDQAFGRRLLAVMRASTTISDRDNRLTQPLMA